MALTHWWPLGRPWVTHRSTMDSSLGYVADPSVAQEFIMQGYGLIMGRPWVTHASSWGQPSKAPDRIARAPIQHTFNVHHLFFSDTHAASVSPVRRDPHYGSNAAPAYIFSPFHIPPSTRIHRPVTIDKNSARKNFQP